MINCLKSCPLHPVCSLYICGSHLHPKRVNLLFVLLHKLSASLNASGLCSYLSNILIILFGRLAPDNDTIFLFDFLFEHRHYPRHYRHINALFGTSLSLIFVKSFVVKEKLCYSKIHTTLDLFLQILYIFI